MLINETFGPTIQGEGVHAGQRVGFIRLANCNLACSWCDTPYSWDWERFDKAAETREVSIQELSAIIANWNVRRVIITGGEPLMQQDALVELFTANPNTLFDIETNGTIAPKEELQAWADMFCVSPKLAHSGDIEKKRLKSNSIQVFSNLAYEGLAFFKFVVKTPEDFDQIEAVRKEFDIAKTDVWVMPEGADAQTQLETLRTLADAVISAGYNLSTRIHTLIWDKKRGV